MDLVSSACSGVFDEIAGTGQVFVGFSGGMDSTVLLHAMAERALDPDRVIAVHVNHGLAVESESWLAHCERFADSIGVGFKAARLDLADGGSLEARARTGRYRVFRDLLGAEDVLLLAHHLDDRDESFLLHLLQGRGVFGMPPERSLGKGTLIRPLLDLPRSTLASYARAHGLSWLEDPMNLDPAMDRNFLRHSVLPVLGERFQALSERFDRIIRHTTDTEHALVETLGLDRHPLPLGVFNGLSRGAQTSVLRLWLTERDAAAGVSDSAIGEFLLQLDADNDRQPELSTRAGTLRRYRRELYLVPPLPVLEPEYPLNGPGVLELPHGCITLASAADQPEATAMIEAAGPLSVTFLPQLDPGTAFRCRGHNRRVREVLREAGIPPWQREIYPLIVDSRGLVAVAGVAVRDPGDLDDPEGRDGSGERASFRLTWNPSREGGEL